MRRSTLALAVVGLLSAAPLFASQNPAPPPADARPARRHSATPPAPSPLGGPTVRVTEAPGAYMSFGGDAQDGRMVRSNLRQYAAIFKEMALGDDQRQQAEAIMREYLDEIRAFQQEHSVDVRRLREQAGLGNAPTDARRRAGKEETDQAPPRRPATDRAPDARPTDQPTDRPADRRTDRPTERPTDRPTDRRPDRATDRRPTPPGDRPVPPTDVRPDAPRRPAGVDRPGAGSPRSAERLKVAADARAQLEALRQAAPPQEPYMKRLYALLSADQQADFETRLEAVRQVQMEQQLKRRLEAAGVDPQAMPGMEGVKIGEDGRPVIDESQLTPQLRQRLRQMHEQRRRMLENRQQRNPAPPAPDDIEFEKPKR